MNTSYLKTFIEVINLKNISKAAEKLFITQPAVSKQLQLLENDFGADLFKKSGREIVPTEEGNMLYKYAKNVLSEENKIYSMLRRDDNKMVGNLTVYTSSMPADYYIHDLIIEFNQMYPDTTFTIKKIDSEMVFRNIEEGFTSFGFTGTPYKNKKIKNICIGEDEVVVVASAKKKEEFNGESIKLDEILKQKFIVREKGSATLQIFENFLIKKHVNLSDLNVIIQAEDNDIIKKFIVNNLGLAVLPRKAVENEIKEGKAFVLNIEGMILKRNLYYVYQNDRYFSKIEERFKEFMIEKHIC
ncbi:MAG: selenium metabolism-associated LysR family transcriptional regulator [Sedimentibacter sp.]